MRAIYIQNLSIFAIREKQVVLLLGISYLTVVLGANHFWYMIYTPTYPDFKPICLGRPIDDPLLYYNALDNLSINEFHLLLSILTFLCSSVMLLEMTLYFSIFKFLIDHDKMVKLVLSDSILKKRMKRNAINLFGHVIIFVVDVFWLLIKVVETWSVKGASPALMRNRRWAFKLSGMCMYGITSFIHIGFSSSLRADTITMLKPFFQILTWIKKTFLKQPPTNSVIE